MNQNEPKFPYGDKNCPLCQLSAIGHCKQHQSLTSPEIQSESKGDNLQPNWISAAAQVRQELEMESSNLDAIAENLFLEISSCDCVECRKDNLSKIKLALAEATQPLREELAICYGTGECSGNKDCLACKLINEQMAHDQLKE